MSVKGRHSFPFECTLFCNKDPECPHQTRHENIHIRGPKEAVLTRNRSMRIGRFTISTGQRGGLWNLAGLDLQLQALENAISLSEKTTIDSENMASNHGCSRTCQEENRDGDFIRLGEAA
jgi:hypothetical protein